MTTPWMATYMKPRGFVNPLSLDPNDILFSDIAHALSNICRFNGHCREFYSVAQHSVNIAEWLKQRGASTETQLVGLFHDASEAYLGDVIRPLKATGLFSEYCRLEKIVQMKIYDKFCRGFIHDLRLLKQADDEILVHEGSQLFDVDANEWRLKQPTSTFRIKPVDPRSACVLFTHLYHDLSFLREAGK